MTLSKDVILATLDILKRMNMSGFKGSEAATIATVQVAFEQYLKSLQEPKAQKPDAPLSTVG